MGVRFATAHFAQDDNFEKANDRNSRSAQLTFADVLLTNTLHDSEVSSLCFLVQQFSGTEALSEQGKKARGEPHVDAMLCGVPPSA